MRILFFLFAFSCIFSNCLAGSSSQEVSQDMINLETKRLEEKLDYANGDCRKQYTRPQDASRQSAWCDEVARSTKKKLDQLKSDPALYFYKNNQKSNITPGSNSARKVNPMTGETYPAGGGVGDQGNYYPY